MNIRNLLKIVDELIIEQAEPYKIASDVAAAQKEESISLLIAQGQQVAADILKNNP